jgi:putative salt-induced outer membrane protein
MKSIIYTLLILMFIRPVFAEFQHVGEASIVLSGGNAELSTYNFKTNNTKKIDRYSTSFGGHYTYGTAGELEIVRNWDVNAKIDTKFTKTLGAFIGEKLEGDKFSGYERRLNTDIGVSDVLFTTDEQELKGEIGYRNFYEKNINPAIESKNDHMGRLNLKYRYTAKDRFVIESYVEYLPNFSESDDYLVNFGPSIAFSLTSIFSFKVGYDGRYDNQPAIEGNRKLDYLYTTSIISKF